MSEIFFKNISKSYENQPDVIKNFTFKVESGEFLVILGGSGCGKTTLLRLLSGLEDPSAGDIFLGGENITWLEPKKRNIAMVFQNYALYPHLTVQENIMYPLSIAKISKEEKIELMQSTAKALKIDDILPKRPGEISGGQRQRVAIGRALVRKPLAFLFDEPLSNLDARLRDELRFEILKMKDQFKITTLFVTHDQNEAMTLGDRMVIMNQGHIEQSDKPERLYHRPQTIFSAKFLGSPNINIIQAKGQKQGVLLMPALNTSIELDSVVQADTNYQIAIRPEKIKIIGNGETNDDSMRIEATVEIKEFSGGRTNYFLRSHECSFWVVTDISEIEKGQNCRVTFHKNDCLLFDENGNLLQGE